MQQSFPLLPPHPLPQPDHFVGTELLTERGLQRMACFVTPPHGVQVTGVSIKPVIINVIPAIKVHLDSVLLQCRYSRSTDKGRIPFVYSFQSLAGLKTRLGALEKERKENERRLS